MTITRKRTEAVGERFPSPSDVPIPPACMGWEEMYPYHVFFSEDRGEFDESRFWFQLASQCPEPFYPFDGAMCEYCLRALSRTNARLFVVPPSLGVEYRILNGYVYLSANPVEDEATIARRAQLFADRGGYYYQHWDELYEQWRENVEEATRELQALVVPDLPEVEDESVVRAVGGVGSSHALLLAYDRLLEGVDRIWQYHFELLNLGYGAYLVFYETCRQAFPGITDQAIAKMVSGIDLLVLRPDEELKRLAALALDLGVAGAVKVAADESDLRAVLLRTATGREWLASLEDAKDPWFHFSYGLGAFYHHHRSWIDDPTLPIHTIGSYVERLEAGEDISRPFEAVLAERERITGEYRALLTDKMRQRFNDGLALARTVFPHVEDHGFYIDHRYFTIFWNKVREFGALLARNGFLAEQEDVFLLRADEVRAALEELRLFWSSGGAGAARGPHYWPPIVARRKSIYEAMREWTPPPALGQAPAAISDSQAIMLFGITTERVQEWLSSEDSADARVVTGCAGSPGVADGRARVILRPDQLVELEEGEILVAPSTSTSWTPVFAKLAAAVLDSGGIMCHAAIVAREYGLPAVVGTGNATKRIRTGDRLHVDADTGVVRILD